MTAFVLKIIASLTMLIDHSAEAFQPYMAYDKYFLLRSVGRIAFPIYIFMIAEGCGRTRNIKRYLARLFVFALISEVPFDLLFAVNSRPSYHNYFSSLNSYFNLAHQNVFFTLFLGALAIYSYGLIKDKLYPAAFIPAIFLALFAEYLNTDYGAAGVIIIFAAYLCNGRFMRALAILAGMVWLYGVEWSFRPDGLQLLAFACVPVVLLLFYNGKKGPGMKWFFYLFYPLHLTAIFFAFILVRGYW